jgi:hypothetical protein
MASNITNELVKDRRDVAAWVIVAGVVAAVIVLGLLNKKAADAT